MAWRMAKTVPGTANDRSDLPKGSTGPVMAAHWRRRRTNGIVTLLYHRIGPQGQPWLLPSLPTDIFARQMAHLAKWYHVISLREAVAFLRGEASDVGRAVVVTFDDGWADNYHYAWPVLVRYRIPATFFLVTEHLTRRTMFGTDRLRYAAYQTTTSREAGNRLFVQLLQDIRSRPSWSADAVDRACAMLGAPDIPHGTADRHVLTWEQVEEMAASGQAFGSHTLTHRDLAQLTPEDQWRELRDSRLALETRVPSSFRPFSYPFGRHSAGLARMCAAVGYDCALTTKRVADANPDIHALGRTKPAKDRFRFAVQVAGIVRAPGSLLASNVWRRSPCAGRHVG